MNAELFLKNFEQLLDTPDAVSRIRRFILDLAVRGRLVRQDPMDEPACVLLKRITKEKEQLVREGVVRKPKSLPEVSRDQAPFDTPISWEWSLLGIVSNITQGFAFQSGDFSESSLEGPPLIKIGDIGSNSPTVFIRGDYDSEFIVQPGELLLGLSGSIKCAPWLGPPALLNQRIAKILPVPNGIDKQWLVFCVQKSIEIWIKETSKFTVQNVKSAQLFEAYVPVPPIAEQRRIAAKVEELIRLCDELEEALQHGEELKAKALEALLQMDGQPLKATPTIKHPAPPKSEAVRIERFVGEDEIDLFEADVPVKRGHGRPNNDQVEIEELLAALEPAPANGKATGQMNVPYGNGKTSNGAAKRGPGRPRKEHGATASDAEEAILGYLQANPGWHGKSAVLEAAAIDAGSWNAAIKVLLEQGKVERQGEKKGARYRGR
jgi:hypothetical protein